MMLDTGAVRPLRAGDADVDRAALGNKAWGIQRMLSLGVPVPPAFVVTTAACARVKAAGGSLPDDVAAALPDAMAHLERKTGRTFGRGEAPLLVSVRSGSAVSMPGMMDTVLNVGLTAEVEGAFRSQVGDGQFVADTRRRFARQYAEIVGHEPPVDPWEQLRDAIIAVFASWDSSRALAYRHDRGLDDEAGTAATVQAMVFGNLDDSSGTGVLFTRDPLTGEGVPFGEWLPRAQGEDVVSGAHDPKPLSALAEQLPRVHAELIKVAARLERDARDVQDIEFTVEGGRLWLLQTRAAKRSPQAAVRLAVALAREGVIDPIEALERVSSGDVEALLRPHVEPRTRARARVIARGRPACPGVASGVIVTDTGVAQARADGGDEIILARPTTDPEDVHAMAVVSGIATELGGSTSHAAVVSRELGVPCVVGCGEGALTPLDGTVVTLDASAGEILEGELSVDEPTDVSSDPDITQLREWAQAAPDNDAAGSLLSFLDQLTPTRARQGRLAQRSSQPQR